MALIIKLALKFNYVTRPFFFKEITSLKNNSFINIKKTTKDNN